MLKKDGFSNRAIAREFSCSPSTVGYGPTHGTPEYSGHGRRPNYSARRGSTVCNENRSRYHRPKNSSQQTLHFIRWMMKQVRHHGQSFGMCVRRAQREHRFPGKESPCTKILYNLLWQGKLPLTLFELQRYQVDVLVENRGFPSHSTENLSRTGDQKWQTRIHLATGNLPPCSAAKEMARQLYSPL